MAGETRAAVVGAIASVACVAISGYFTVRASHSSDDAKTASSQVTNASSEVAAVAVNEGYDTTVKPFFIQTKDLTDALQARMDMLQSEVRALRISLAAVQRGPGNRLPPAPPPVALAPPHKELNVPKTIGFRSDVFLKPQRFVRQP